MVAWPIELHAIGGAADHFCRTRAGPPFLRGRRLGVLPGPPFPKSLELALTKSKAGLRPGLLHRILCSALLCCAQAASHLHRTHAISQHVRRRSRRPFLPASRTKRARQRHVRSSSSRDSGGGSLFLLVPAPRRKRDHLPEQPQRGRQAGRDEGHARCALQQLHLFLLPLLLLFHLSRGGR